MQEEISLHFVAFNFLSCYHVDNKFYKWSSTEAFFQEGIQLCQFKDSYPEKSSVMQLLQWDGPIQKENYQTERVLVQILKSTPLIFEKGQQQSAILHEITIVPWVCEAVESIGLCFTKIFQLRRLDDTRIFVILSKLIDDDWIHCLRNGHLGCLLSKEKLEKILKNSDYLEEALQEKLRRDAVVRLGMTAQKAVANCMQISKAKKLRIYVYDKIDISFATLEDISARCTFIDPILISTPNLELVVKISNQEDISED